MFNQCIFVGRLASDPEKKFTQTGKAVTNFRLAVSEKRGGQEHTEWVSIICWEKTAEFVAEYMQKGNMALVVGKQQTRKWQDKEGKDRYTTEIVAHTVQSLSTKQADRQESRPFQSSGEEDVPF